MRHVFAGRSSFNLQSTGNTGRGNGESGTEGTPIFRGITTEAGQVQAKSKHFDRQRLDAQRSDEREFIHGFAVAGSLFSPPPHGSSTP